MKFQIVSTAGAILLTVSAMVGTGTASAAVAVYEHLPVVNSNFISRHGTGGPILADDFVPVGSGPVTSVTWWGSRAQSDSWEITFHTDGGGVPNIDDPVDGGLVQHIPVIASGVDIGGGIFEFTAAWNPMDLSLNAGTNYWFSTANFLDGWTWALGDPTGPSIGSELYDAAESRGALCSNGGPHCGAWRSLDNTDFAFRINAVPVPAAVWLFGSGLIGMVGLARRKA